ncbi:MAG: HutD family protein [Rubrivivax sp.]
MRIIRLNDVKATPWLNSGGTTRNLWLGPSAAQWQWRISVATIDSDGAFSRYPGVERHLAVLQGNGVRLRFADGERQATATGDPLHFDGDAAPHCSLIDGPTLDLNLLVRREIGTGVLQRAEPGAAWHSLARRRAVWCGSAMQLKIEGLPPCSVPANALACIDHASGKAWTLDSSAHTGEPAAAWWIAIESPTH